MGSGESAYMAWASARAAPALRRQIDRVRTAIQRGAGPDPGRWPDPIDCMRRLNDPDEIVAIMAAQMLWLYQRLLDFKLDGRLRLRVAALIDSAQRAPWYLRHRSR